MHGKTAVGLRNVGLEDNKTDRGSMNLADAPESVSKMVQGIEGDSHFVSWDHGIERKGLGAVVDDHAEFGCMRFGYDTKRNGVHAREKVRTERW